VVQVFDSGVEEGCPYIVMELLEGDSLDVRLAERGPLTPGELRKVFGEVARALAKAHSLGVVHRDIKPSNIFLSREGPYEITKLVDFGIAKVKSEALSFTHVGTKMGTLLGTPQYMSPEQARGSCTVDYRTDLWALAIVACECLTGRCPFSGRTVGDLTIQICTERPTAPSDLGEVPPGFDAWFFKATGKSPGQRFKSMAAMEGALTPILAAAEARASAARRSRVWLRPRWELPPLAALPSVSQIRSVSATVLTRLESQWLELRSSARTRLLPWWGTLPQERRRVALFALLSLCGLTLLAASGVRRHNAANAPETAPASATQPTRLSLPSAPSFRAAPSSPVPSSPAGPGSAVDPGSAVEPVAPGVPPATGGL
jgi:serine/threonine-protein kinase